MSVARIPVLLLAIAADAPAENDTMPETGFVDRVFEDADGEHGYVVYVPKDYSAERKWPTIVFLHGSGERGTDNRKQISVGLGPEIRKRPDFPFLVVFPQCEDRRAFAVHAWAPHKPDGQRALAILEDVIRDFSVDEDRLLLTGVSMGGFGTFRWLSEMPNRWAGAAPICGGGDPKWAATLKSTPIWAFHGSADPIVPARLSRLMIESIRDSGGDARLTEYPGVRHDSWIQAYAEDELYRWMGERNRSR